MKSIILLTAVINAVDTKRAALRAQLVAERMALKSLMTADEWAKVFAADPAAKAALAPGTKAACCEASSGRAAMLARTAASPVPATSP